MNIHRRPDVNYLQVFGCTCYVQLQKNQRNKLEARVVKCIFLYYPYEKKGYKCNNPISNMVILLKR